MRAVLDILFIVMDLLVFVLITQAILSWLIAFGVVNARNQFVSMIWNFTRTVTEPLLKPIRRVIPSFGGMDLSPLVLILGIYFLRRVIVYYVYPNVF